MHIWLALLIAACVADVATTAATPSPRNRAASSEISGIGSTTWYGPKALGKTSVGASVFVNPINAIFAPSTSLQTIVLLLTNLNQF